jgi:hypothetical protein
VACHTFRSSVTVARSADAGRFEIHRCPSLLPSRTRRAFVVTTRRVSDGCYLPLAHRRTAPAFPHSGLSATGRVRSRWVAGVAVLLSIELAPLALAVFLTSAQERSQMEMGERSQ